ncbi:MULTISPECIES: preprotein translocase subunit SecE [Spongiibacter]|uniref:preprotein translocase subunit SecE n=2 Tax=Spongiibacteraceae TaxID=1706375 RepID=UPI0003B6FF3B|nr:MULTISPECIES: preprotein translocase subunit SecE [Spongiibacter]MAY38156.1 preprotein translocase subunit SecE [Spongiibacter sp.]MBI59580.1 preprotein translocase subunit SecE [Spongiibacter sp.]MBU73421.1 preprotein translocase subunit SecE [Spongiibacter sp.]|tara:strand:- start:14120 stop:14485 length:366 start_codon:yes stop_codon:yes gene_type:complete
MVAKAEEQSRLDGLKWVVVALLVAVGVGGNMYFSDESLLYRVIALLVLAVAAGFVAAQTSRGAAFFSLVKGARNEIRKVVWPTRQEGTQTTLIVVAFVVVAALILWGLDSLLGWLASMVIG